MGKGKAWDRLPNESSAAYTAFKIYLEFGGERSLTKVEQKLNKKRGQLGNWSSKYNWVERAAAYDSSIVEADRKRKAERWSDAIEKLWKVANLFADRVLEKMMTLDTSKMSTRATIDMGLAVKDMLNTIAELEASKGEADRVTEIVIKKTER